MEMKVSALQADIGIEHQASLGFQLAEIKDLLQDPTWTEICINKPGQVITESRQGWHVHERATVDYNWCYDLAKLVSNAMSVNIGPESPSVSAMLPNGQRIQIVMPPRVPENTISITIRKPPQMVKTIEEFIAEGAFEKTRHVQSLALTKAERAEIETDLDEVEQELLTLIRGRHYRQFFALMISERRTQLVSGSTGAGKTTFCNALLRLLPPEDRYITVEDVQEVKMDHVENKVHMFFNKKNGAKAVFEDVLRMRPDIVFPAELRGDETYFFLQNVLNSGHPGAITTCHANNTKLAFMRLALIIQSSPEGKALSYENIMGMLHSLISCVIQIVRQRDRSRTITEIYFDPAYARKQMG